ncbi:MAG: tetratricopeptide repeat protein [Anaeromyxobacteraceae bacterium]
MENAKTIESGASLSELLELPAEVMELVHGVAAAALEAGRAAEAEKVLEGLVAIHPRDPVNWALLARAHLRTGKDLAARFAAEVGRQLAPDEPLVRLAHAEVLLGLAGSRAEAVEALRGLRSIEGAVGERASALLAGLGERVGA